MDERKYKKIYNKKIYKTVTIFHLGGISNLPSKNHLDEIKHRVLSLLKEFIKFFF